MGLPSALGQFNITYYDNYDYENGTWNPWGGSDAFLSAWDDVFRVDFTWGKTAATKHCFSSIDTLDLRGGLYSQDDPPDDAGGEDWNPLRSIGDPHCGDRYCHWFGAVFTGRVHLNAGDNLTVYSDDDVFVFLDDKTAWDEAILSVPYISYFESDSYIVPEEQAGFHWMTIKFSERCPQHSGIEMMLNDLPLQAVRAATVRIEPETLNLAGNGVLTAFIEPAGEDSVAQIDAGTIQCAGASAVGSTVANDKLIVKFNCQDLQGVVPGDQVEMAVSGQFTDGRWFYGTDTIRVIEQVGKKK
jgi:hypothetical protein